ncbi:MULTISPECIES: TetR/AcrR family transcriptional regulator [unclassified Nocardioides]|uniref:TetR/AcrR family transcriptional regulator n=1 Tax=unclassified Nocardioides TaxID=2615069 RepID=UPI003621DD17
MVSPKARAAPRSDIARRRMERREAGRRRSDERWSEIIAGAAQVFRRLGYAQATLEDVAQEVGINRATLYYYVGTKEELLVSMLDRPIEQLRTRLEEIAEGAEPPSQQLARALREYTTGLAEEPELTVFVAENVHRAMKGPEADRIRDNADRYGRVLAGIIAKGARTGEFRSDIEPSVAVLGILGMFNWMHRWFDPSGPRSLTEIGEDFVALALGGLQPS